MGGWACPGSRLPDDDAEAGRASRPGPAPGDPAAALDDGPGPGPGDRRGPAAGARGAVPGNDPGDGHFEWLVREMEAGRLLPPPESAAEGPAVSVSLGDACDVDPGLLAAVCGPDGLGGQALSAVFGQGEAADVLGPGPVLAALTAQAVSRVVPGPAPHAAVPAGAPGPQRDLQTGLPPGPHPDPRPVVQPGPLSDDELVGVLQAARRLENLAAWQQTVAIAEFARRRQARFEAAKAAGAPAGCRDGEFPGEELAMELVATGPYTSGRIDTAVELTARLPLTLAGMEAGLIDLGRACAIAARTQAMSDAGAAYADRVLAAAAPGLRLDQLARRAEALEKKLAPDAVKARRELARQLGQRVEARREDSGNASLAGRELDTADVIASKAYIDALAARLRSSGLFTGPIGRLRALVLTDLTQGRNPLDRLTVRPTPAPPGTQPGSDELAPGVTGDGHAPGWQASGGCVPAAGQPGSAPSDSDGPAFGRQASVGASGPASGQSGHAPPGNDGPGATRRARGAADGDRTGGQPGSAPPDDDAEAGGTSVTSHDNQPADPPGTTPSADGHPPVGREDWKAATPVTARGPLARRDDEEDHLSDGPWPGPASGDPVPLPALVNLLVPAGTMLGWGTAPAQAAGWGLLDADETQALVQAASQHPRTRWCMTIIAPDGTALAHGCATGQHPWPLDSLPPPSSGNPPPPPGKPAGSRPRPGPPPHQAPDAPGGPGGLGDAPAGRRDAPSGPSEASAGTGHVQPPQQAAQAAQAAQLLRLLRRLNITLEPIAAGPCDHTHAEDHYVPSRRLRHLIHARNQTCTAPACNAQAQYCDLDHTVPYPDGPTDECNLNPKCRRHHRTKQAPGWNATQPAPGTATWTTPAGRTHTTTPTTYNM